MRQMPVSLGAGEPVWRWKISLHAVIADDEPLARERMRQLLSAEPDVEVVEECADGDDAVEVITRIRPELAFLDVEMPGRDGLEVVEALAGMPLPAVIFVSGFSRYALEAFDAHAVDYLLKPVDRDRFCRAMSRARAVVEGRDGNAEDRARAAARAMRDRSSPLQRMAIKADGRISFIRVRDIEWVEAAGNYVRLHVDGEPHMVRATMAAVESCLDPEDFMRVHRSVIVNVDQISEIQPWFHGEYVVVLKDGTRINLSRGYRHRLDRFLELCTPGC